MNYNESCYPVKLARALNMCPEQTEDNELRFLIESPVPCSGINSNYATWDFAYEFRIHAVFSKSPLSSKVREVSNNNEVRNHYFIFRTISSEYVFWFYNRYMIKATLKTFLRAFKSLLCGNGDYS